MCGLYLRFEKWRVNLSALSSVVEKILFQWPEQKILINFFNIFYFSCFQQSFKLLHPKPTQNVQKGELQRIILKPQGSSQYQWKVTIQKVFGQCV